MEDAREADLPAILEIHNEVVASSTAIFSDVPDTLAGRRRWFASRIDAGYPVLVARVEDQVAGFASYGPFRTWPGYALTVEHSIHVASARRAQGVGTALMAQLLARARVAGMHAVVAGLDAGNEASLRLHARFGFQRVGEMPEVASKFGRWLDLVLLELLL